MLPLIICRKTFLAISMVWYVVYTAPPSIISASEDQFLLTIHCVRKMELIIINHLICTVLLQSSLSKQGKIVM